MPRQRVASKANRKEASRSNTTARRERIAMDTISKGALRGDYTNRSDMVKSNRVLTNNEQGNRAARYRDLVSAFGRVKKGVDIDNIEVVNGNGAGGRSVGSILSFSAG